MYVRDLMLKRRKTKKKNNLRFAYWKIFLTFAVKKTEKMTSKEFKEYLRESLVVMECREKNLTTMLLHEEKVLGTEFLDAYDSLVRYDLSVVRSCLAHYRGLYDKGGWLVRRLLRKRLACLGKRHGELLGRLMLIGIYKRVNHPNPLLYVD